MADTMTEKFTTEAQKMTTEAQKLFTGMMGETLPRWTQAMDEFAKQEAKAADQLRNAFTEYNRLAHAQLEYALKLSSDLREMSLQNLKKVTTVATPAN